MARPDTEIRGLHGLILAILEASGFHDRSTSLMAAGRYAAWMQSIDSVDAKQSALTASRNESA